MIRRSCKPTTYRIFCQFQHERCVERGCSLCCIKHYQDDRTANKRKCVQFLISFLVICIYSKMSFKDTRVLISRGCKSPDVLQSHSMTSTRMNGDSTKTYIQFCLTDLCNVGDGRKWILNCLYPGLVHNLVTSPLSSYRIKMLRL